MSEFGGAGKRSVEEGDDANAIDRLSHLPDFIIHHILSFLDTKSAVQTCVLSRSWICAWKHVPVLDFRRDSFLQYSSFFSYVDRVLSLRHPLNARKISYTNGEGSEDRDRIVLVRLIQCAVSEHTTEHLVISLSGEGFRFSDLFGSILNSNLKTLELNGVSLDSEYESPAFRLLTSLHLDNCLMSCSLERDRDPFSKFPSLENLVLRNCGHFGLKVCGLHLLSLKIVRMYLADLEILAPKLRFFSLWSNWTLLSLQRVILPSLDHAHIQLNFRYMKANKGLVEQDLICLFHGLRNAKSLKLHPCTIQALSEFYGFLEKQPSPFTRLELLIVEADNIPSQLVDYFFKGTTAKPTVKFLQL